MKNNAELHNMPRLYRGPIARGIQIKDAPRVEQDGGAYNAGLIRGAAVITRGEAVGHDMWIDTMMLSQVAKAFGTMPAGPKSRFTHPGISGDGLGRALGRYRSAELDGDVVRADLHIFETAHDTPDGDLAQYIMRLATEDPAAFGNSIAFDPDFDAEQLFVKEHLDESGKFQSPDSDNAKNWSHARLSELRTVDVVDEPAANPDGLFHRGDEIAAHADEFLAYALGRTGRCPAEWAFNIAPERVRGFVARYFERERLALIRRLSDDQRDALEILVDSNRE